MANKNIWWVRISNALSGRKGVSEEMRGKIVSLASEMGYSKIILSNKSSYTIGVIVSERTLPENQSLYLKLYQEVSALSVS